MQVSDGANAVTAELEVTLQDVEATVTVAADAATIEEGEAAVFTVTRAGDLSGALTVAVAVGETGTVLASGGSGTKQVSFADGTQDRNAERGDGGRRDAGAWRHGDGGGADRHRLPGGHTGPCRGNGAGQRREHADAERATPQEVAEDGGSDGGHR